MEVEAPDEVDSAVGEAAAHREVVEHQEEEDVGEQREAQKPSWYA